MNKKEFSIIVLHYGDQNNLFNLLDCLKNQNNNSFELCVINNDKPFFLGEKYYDYKIVNTNNNLGYSYSCNLGYEESNTDCIFYITSDCYIEDKDFLSKMYRTYTNSDTKIVLGPNIIYQGEKVYENGLMTIDVLASPAQSLKNHFYIDGCAFMINKNFFNEIGKLDERYFLYGEDVDLCWKVHLLGGEIILDKDIYLHHEAGATSLGHDYKSDFLIPFSRRYNAEKNAICNMIKNYSLLSLCFITPYYLFIFLLEFFYYVVTGNIKMSFHLTKAIIWNFNNLNISLKLRRNIQSKRKKSDLFILKKMNFIANKFKYLKLGLPKFK